MFDGKSILITGGTGSFGHSFVETLLKRYKPRRIVAGSSRLILAVQGISREEPTQRKLTGLTENGFCSGPDDNASLLAEYEGKTLKRANLR